MTFSPYDLRFALIRCLFSLSNISKTAPSRVNLYHADILLLGRVNMMDWQFIFTTINAIVITVALVILIIQTWIFRKQMVILQEQTKAALEASRSLSYTQLWEMEFKVDDMFLEKPHLRKYFYGGVPLDENNTLYAEAEAVAEKMLDVIEHLLWQATLFPNLYVHGEPVGGTKWETWQKYIIDMVTT
jgi:hypothetical protein